MEASETVEFVLFIIFVIVVFAALSTMCYVCKSDDILKDPSETYGEFNCGVLDYTLRYLKFKTSLARQIINQSGGFYFRLAHFS